MPVLVSCLAFSLLLAPQQELPSIKVGGAIPGVVMAFGPQATVLAVSKDGSTTRPSVVGATFGKGKAVAMGHGAMLDGLVASKENAIFFWGLWSKGNGKIGLIGRGIPAGDSEFVSKMASYALADWRKALAESSSVVIGNNLLESDPATFEALRTYVRNGGGLLALDTPWGWKQLNPTKSIRRDHPLQKLLAPIGIGFADGYLDKSGDNILLVTPSKFHHVQDAKKAFEGTETLNAEDARVVSDTLMSAIGDLQETQPLRTELQTMIGKQGNLVIPTEKKPIKATDFRTRLAMAAFDQSWRDLPLSQVVAHPAAVDFPGAVGASEKRETVTISLGGGKKNWWSTGRFAAPGERVAVRLGVGMGGKDLRIRIGGHTDSLWHLDSWQRFPSISAVVPVKNSYAEIVNPFGGLVYLECNQALPSGTVELEGTVAAPTYFLGKTTDAEWARLQKADVPWGEIVGSQCAISVPSSVLKKLKNPKEVAEYWDEVLRSAEGFFAVTPGSTEHRYQADRQISAGYMHSGYPIMTWLDVQEKFVDIKILRGPDGGTNWGFYHELGHNYQESEWTWDGWVETTNNLFSLYACEKFNKDAGGHGAMSPSEVAKRLSQVAASPGSEDFFQKDPWFGLTFWIQIQREFGFPAVTKFFAKYRTMKPNERPRGDQARMDAFVVNMSEVIGRDISGYAKKWGMPVSAGAVEKVKGLPSWGK
jgi:hypothetical protein